MAKKKKQEEVVWMSRDSRNHTCYYFWTARPKHKRQKGYQRVEKNSNLQMACHTFVTAIIPQFTFNRKGLLKLTITAERIE